MFPIPVAAEPLAESFRGAFTRPTFERFMTLVAGLIVTMGRRTVSRALRVMEPVLQGHWCGYHRLYSQAKYSSLGLGRILAGLVIALVPADQPVILAADDTVDGKTGPHVWAKGAHRDGGRSSRGKNAVKWGHKWLVVCVLVKLPKLNRPWALPVLCGLCCSEKVAKKSGARRATPSQRTQSLLIQLMRWFPERKFVLLADARAASHKLACFVYRHRDRVTLISRLRSDANLYGPPKRKSRLAYKGKKIPSPRKRVPRLKPITRKIAWYGSSRRKVRYVTDTGLWFSVHSFTVVPIRWVCVLAEKGLEDAYFYTTQATLDAGRIVELYAMRWNIEVTFEECRALLGLETTRHWCRRSVERVTPILFGLFAAVGLIWNQMHNTIKEEMLSQTPCYHKKAMTFSDVLFLVRRQIWSEGLLQRHAPGRRGSWLTVLPPPLRQTILNELSAAA